MNGAHILMLLLTLTLPMAALITRRPPLRQTAKFAAAWVVLIVASAVAVSQIDRLRSDNGKGSATSGRTVRVERSDDGHFWVNAKINGIARRMLVDSGATTTALSEATAKAARLDLDEGQFPRLIQTANGQVTVRTARVERLTIGAIESRDLPVVISGALADHDLLGMNFLSRLASWRVEGRSLILTPYSSGT